jgi:hypothetical protein
MLHSKAQQLILRFKFEFILLHRPAPSWLAPFRRALDGNISLLEVSANFQF